MQSRMEQMEEESLIDDDYRIEYLRAHIQEMKKAVCEDGVDLIGYPRGTELIW